MGRASRDSPEAEAIMPAGPFAHICFLVRDLAPALEDWKRILAELDPAQLEAPVVMVDRWEAGEDVMSSATFVNPSGTEIQLLCPLNEGPLKRRLDKHGEHVHHICFTSADLPATVNRLAENGIELTSAELQNDPALPWQYWTFIAKGSSHGALVELAYPYRPVDGVWEPGDGVPTGPS
jgi:methylmalonyl-CoA/ethylmalonyl-CoA epimerase